MRPRLRAVSRICNWIHDHIAYVRGASDEETTADETLLKRAGCAAISRISAPVLPGARHPGPLRQLLRLRPGPARLPRRVRGLSRRRWWLFDATRQANLDGLVRIGVGRDAAEIAFSTPFGEMKPTGMEVRIDRADGAPEAGERTGRGDRDGGRWP